ncbi:MAG: chromate transporter [Erysipelotrichaceae bacterium]|nr:chromate transporter [Erysipelotrichaceae bacterium]
MNESDRSHVLRQLFKTSFLISASTSGGYTIVSVMKDIFVNRYQWLSEEEMLDLLSIAQATPGAIAINTSVLVGYHMAGIAGGLLTMLGTVLPPLVIMSIVATCYGFFADNQILRFVMKGMQAGVCALLISVTLDLFLNLTKQKSVLSYLLLILSFIIVRYTEISILYLALFCAIAGIVKVLLLKKAGAE